MEKVFPIANVTFRQGLLVIDTTGYSCEGKHYDAQVETNADNTRVIVKGDKPEWGLSLHKGEFPLDEITENSIVEYKPYWPFGPVKKRSNNIVEFKERTRRVYHSDKWIIIEKVNP